MSLWKIKISKLKTPSKTMARRLDPKFSEKNFSIGKNNFNSEKFFRIGKTSIFFLEYIALYRAVDVRILLRWCALIFFWPIINYWEMKWRTSGWDFRIQFSQSAAWKWHKKKRKIRLVGNFFEWLSVLSGSAVCTPGYDSTSTSTSAGLPENYLPHYCQTFLCQHSLCTPD